MPREKNKEQLLEEIYCSLKQLDNDALPIIKAWSDLTSIILLPPIFYFALQTMGFVEYLTPYYISYFAELLKKSIHSKIAPSVEIRRICTANIKRFEEVIVGMTKILLNGIPEFRKNTGIANIEDVDSWNVPHRLIQLASTTDNHHLLFYLAKLIDSNISEVRLLKEEFYLKILNCLIVAGYNFKSNSPFPERTITAFPELKDVLMRAETFNSTSNISTYRATELMRDRYPEFANYEKFLEQQTGETGTRLGQWHLHRLQYIVALQIAFFAKTTIARSLIKKIFQLNWYLTVPISTEANYSHMSALSLKRELQNLNKAHLELTLYHKKYKLISNLVALLLLALGLYLFFKGVETGFYLLRLLYVPLFIGIATEKVTNYLAESKDTKNVSQQISKLMSDLRYIFGDASKHITLTDINNNRLSLSLIKITIRRHEKISAQNLSQAVMQVLYHANIFLMPSEDIHTEFYLSAQTSFGNRAALKQQLHSSLTSAKNMYRLKEQIEYLLKIFPQIMFQKTIKLNADGIFTAEYIITLPKSLDSLKPALLQFGSLQHENGLELKIQNPFTDEQLESFTTLLKQHRAVISTPGTPPHSAEVKSPHKKSSPSNEQAAPEDKPAKDPAPPKRIIRWRSGAIYPSDNVQEVRGALNQYIFWTLKPEDFGEHQNAFKPFKEKSAQKASKALGKTGIKDRPTLITIKNKVTSLPAHVKIPGKEHGNQGVVLATEIADTGEKLYITCGFEPNIHRGIKNN